MTLVLNYRIIFCASIKTALQEFDKDYLKFSKSNDKKENNKIIQDECSIGYNLAIIGDCKWENIRYIRVCLVIKLLHNPQSTSQTCKQLIFHNNLFQKHICNILIEMNIQNESFVQVQSYKLISKEKGGKLYFTHSMVIFSAIYIQV